MPARTCALLSRNVLARPPLLRSLAIGSRGKPIPKNRLEPKISVLRAKHTLHIKRSRPKRNANVTADSWLFFIERFPSMPISYSD
jgi:hypothetical protein